MPLIYCDHNATTPILPEVREAMLSCLGNNFGNPSSVHQAGQAARDALDSAREKIAATINVHPKELVFTAGGTESNNLAIKGIALEHWEKKGRIITTAVEHSSVLNVCKYLGEQGFDIVYLPVDSECRIDPDDLSAAINDKTILVTIMHANNETGTIVDIEALGILCRKAGVPLHTDAIQSYGKIAIDLQELPVDMFTASVHKINGPKGAGFLWARRGLKYTSLFHGGSHEYEHRAGTENVPGIVGMAKAAELRQADMEKNHLDMLELTAMLRDRIIDEIPDVLINGDQENKISNTLNVTFNGVEGEALLINMDLDGICTSSGSACSSGKSDPSHVLLAMGRTEAQAKSAVRFSFGHGNTPADIDAIMDTLNESVPALKKLSSL